MKHGRIHIEPREACDPNFPCTPQRAHLCVRATSGGKVLLALTPKSHPHLLLASAILNESDTEDEDSLEFDIFGAWGTTTGKDGRRVRAFFVDTATRVRADPRLLAAE